MEEKNYPYLGRNYVDGKAYVVMFLEPDTGVVVMNDTVGTRIRFGMYGGFAEEKFEVLPPDECVRLSN